MQTKYVDCCYSQSSHCFFIDILVCINHIDQLCSCSPRKYCLWYRYTLDEMTAMLDALRERLDLCQKWKLLVHRVISTDHQTLIGRIE
jgi:histone demethylase JARID1